MPTAPDAKRAKLAAGAAMAVAAAIPAAANAATITVTSLGDTIADDNQCTLREAIINANDNALTHDDCLVAGANPDTIDFSVTGTITLGGSSIDITDSLTIDGPGQASLTIDANENSRIFTLNDGTGTVIDVAIQDVTLTNGNSSLESSVSGGAIFSAGETLTLTNVTISNSVTDGGSGGGVFVEGGEGGLPDLTVTDSIITGNTAGCCGGGIGTTYTSVTITGTQITDNDAQQGGGAAFYVSRGVSIDDSTITGNDASYSGGGLYLYGLYSGEVRIENSTISNNTSLDIGGGASIENLYGNLTIANTTISGNEAVYSGGLYISSVFSATLDTLTVTGNIATTGPGGVHLRGLYNADIVDSQISGNQAADAGGVLAYLAYNLDIVNSTIAQNTASNYAGGLLLDVTQAGIDLTTIAGNSANEGGNIWVGDALVDIRNSIVADGTAPTGPDIHMASVDAAVAADWSIVETVVSGTGTYTPTNVSTGPALLGPLQNNGGPTMTMRPDAASPAIDGGDPAFAGPETTDQRKFPRPVGRVDMGAVEVNHGTVSIVPPSPIAENAGPLMVQLTRTGGSEGEVTVTFSTAGGTATSNVDFTATSIPVTFLDGEISKFVSVSITNDLDAEPSEQFTVQITGDADVLGATTSALATILDDDTTADLVMTKNVTSPGPFVPGSQVTFAINVTNNGPANTTNVVVNDPVPAGTSYISANPTQGTCNLVVATVTCNLGSLNNGASATITLTLQINNAGQITNIATAQSALADPSPATASATIAAAALENTPALSEWMLIALAAALAAVAATRLRV